MSTMIRSLVMLLFLCSLHDTCASAGVPDGYVYHAAARGFLKLHRAPEPWDSARLRCHHEGAVLASPLHAGLLSTVHELQASEAYDLPVLFSGVHAIFGEGLFNSVEGVPLKEMWIPWAREAARGSVESLQRCLVYFVDGTLGEQACETALPYFCFAELSTCEPGGRKKSFLTDIGDYQMDGRTGSAYKVHTAAQTWSGAYRVCQLEGAHLAIVNSHLEAQVLKELFAKYPDSAIAGATAGGVAAVGFHSWRQTGSWWTVHGKTLEEAGYAGWGGGQPSSASPCGGMFRDGSLDDLFPDLVVAFICEKTPVWWPGRK